MQEEAQEPRQQMNIGEFDEFLRIHHAVEFVYDSISQPDYDKWNGSPLFELVFRQWTTVISPNTLILSSEKSSMHIHRFRHAEVMKVDDGIYCADIVHSGLDGQNTTRLTIYTRHN